MPGVRRQAQEGVLPGGDRLQGPGFYRTDSRKSAAAAAPATKDKDKDKSPAESSSSTSDSGSSNGTADKPAAKKTEPAKSSSASEKVA